MSQKGGTYRVSSEPSGTTKAPAQSESSPQVGNSDATKSDSQQWEVVNKSEEEDQNEANSQEEHSHGDNFLSQAGITIGWGKWKFTLFSWDVNIHRHSKSSK